IRDRNVTGVQTCALPICDVLVKSEEEAIQFARKYLTYFPQNFREKPKQIEVQQPNIEKKLSAIVPENQNAPFSMYDLIQTLINADSFCEIKKRFAKELITGFARLDGEVNGIIAYQPHTIGGVLFSDSFDKATKFIQLCDAFNIPLLFLTDVPGFMIGTKVEKQGIIRHGAKMLVSMSEATVPKISVIVRKAYGAGLYAMAGPGFEPDCCLALPSAQIAVMGPEAAVNAVYANKIASLEGEERQRFIKEKQEEYRDDIDVYR